MHGRHTKVPGFVDWIEDDCWVGRVTIDGREFWAYFDKDKHPIPKGLGRGNFFTIHTTKRGHQYFYWLTRPLISRKRVKRAKQKAREWRKMFDEVSVPSEE